MLGHGSFLLVCEVPDSVESMDAVEVGAADPDAVVVLDVVDLVAQDVAVDRGAVDLVLDDVDSDVAAQGAEDHVVVPMGGPGLDVAIGNSQRT